jgi:hypothetical protein
MDGGTVNSAKTALILGLIFFIFIVWICFGRPGSRYPGW